MFTDTEECPSEPQPTPVECAANPLNGTFPVQQETLKQQEDNYAEQAAVVRPVTIASVRDMPGVDRAYLGHLAELPSKKIAVAVTTGFWRCDTYPMNLDDRTPVLLLGPYDECVWPGKQRRWSGPLDRRSAVDTCQRAMKEWYGRANVVVVSLSENDERGFSLSVSVYAKGIIPDGEEPFPKEYDGIPVRVIEERIEGF
jgi:hypothetical protein